MRVLSCSQGFPRHPADHHATFILDHARALVAAGVEVEIACPAGAGLPGRDAYGDVAIRRFRYAPRRFETLAYSGGMHHRAKGAAALLLPLFVLGFLVHLLRRARHVDVIHAHWWVPSGVVAVIAGALTRTPVVVQLHGTDAAIAVGPVRIPARLVLRRADAVIAASEALGSWARDVAGVDPVVLPMPLRPEIATTPVEPPPVDGPVLAVGRLVKEKGFDVLVRAVGTADVPLVLVGTGSEQPRLEALAVEVGADVTFAGPVPPGDLLPYYRDARLVAVPSRREGFGLVAAEALARGRAVVASAAGGLPEIVTDGTTGSLVPPDDPDALAKALLATDPALGAAGPAAVAHLHPDRIGATTLAVYRDVTSRST